MLFSWIVLVLLIVILIIFLSLFLDYYDKKRIENKIEKFETYISVLTYYMQKAYDIIYKDKMLIYSIEATKVSDKEFNIISKDYAYLVVKMMGPKLTSEFIELYGNEETFLFNVIEFFNTKNETDEIRKKAQENLVNDSQELLQSELNVKNLL